MFFMNKETRFGRGKLLLFIAFVGLVVLLGFLFRDSLSLDSLARSENQLRQFQTQHPWLTFGLAFLLYVAVAVSYTHLTLPTKA